MLFVPPQGGGMEIVMIYEKIYLLPGNEDAYLETYVADRLPCNTPKALLVIPGGGYGGVCSDREGEPIAQAFMPYGFNCFVLHYSVAGKRIFPSQLIEASAAVKYIKDNAERYNINPDKVFAIGFSAGGHLTGTLGTLWHRREVYDVLDMPFGYNRPTGVMLIYPVITGNPAFSHAGSFMNLLGTDEPSADALSEVSLEKQVDERSSPAFLVHTANDEVVKVQNSLLMAEAYAAAGLPFELHIYPDSPHGMALGNEITYCGNEKWNRQSLAQWVKAAVLWADTF